MGQIAAISCQMYKWLTKVFVNSTHVSPANTQGIDRLKDIKSCFFFSEKFKVDCRLQIIVVAKEYICVATVYE